MNAKQTIDHLNKVTLALSANGTICHGAPLNAEQELTFVYGIGTQGITAFEQQLHGKGPGDTLIMSVDRHNFSVNFEHLGLPLLNAVGTHPPFDLKIEIKSVSAASDLEVVRALAQKGESGGCGGDCGCGC